MPEATEDAQWIANLIPDIPLQDDAEEVAENAEEVAEAIDLMERGA